METLANKKSLLSNLYFWILNRKAILGKAKSSIQRNRPKTKFLKRKTLKESIDEFLDYPYQQTDFSRLIEAINSNNVTFQHFGVIGLRKLVFLFGRSSYPQILQIFRWWFSFPRNNKLRDDTKVHQYSERWWSAISSSNKFMRK